MLPLLMLILFGALDLARVYDAYVSLQNASREGARYLADHPSATDVQTAVNRELDQTGITGVTVTFSCSAFADDSPVACNLSRPGDRVKVGVSYPFGFVTTYILGLNRLTLSTAAVMVIAR